MNDSNDSLVVLLHIVNPSSKDTSEFKRLVLKPASILKANICISVFVRDVYCSLWSMDVMTCVSVMKRKRKTRSATHEVRNCILIIGIIVAIGDKWRDIVRR